MARRVLEQASKMAIGGAATTGHEQPRRRGFLTPRALSAALRAGEEVSDQEYERFVATRFQVACREATPLAIAKRAAQLLTEGKALRVLDVGAGIGKFSVVGALTGSAIFTGVERQLSLVRAARGIALRLGAQRITFVHGSVTDMEFGAFDAIYILDPALSQGVSSSHLATADGADPLASCTISTWRKLRDAREGTRIVTYFGHCAPPGCRVLKKEPAGVDQLVLFVKE